MLLPGSPEAIYFLWLKQASSISRSSWAAAIVTLPNERRASDARSEISGFKSGASANKPKSSCVRVHEPINRQETLGREAYFRGFIVESKFYANIALYRWARFAQRRTSKVDRLTVSSPSFRFNNDTFPSLPSRPLTCSADFSRRILHFPFLAPRDSPYRQRRSSALSIFRDSRNFLSLEIATAANSLALARRSGGSRLSFETWH